MSFTVLFEGDVIDLFAVVFDLFWNRMGEVFDIRITEDVTGQGGVYVRAVYERIAVGSASAVHPAGVEGGAASHGCQLGLDAGAAAVWN